VLNGWRRWSDGHGVDLGYAWALFATGVIVNLSFARLGVMLLDASIVFDGGWRILSGQVPWRDFAIPYGVVPSAIQALFFAAFGRTWFAYALHASIANGLFAVLVYGLLVVLRLPRGLAFFYGLCSTWFFYPMVGVPFMEQHSFLFTLAAITMAVSGTFATAPGGQRAAWSFVAPLVGLAFLSKQVPVVFALPAMAALLVLPGTVPVRVRLVGLVRGITVCVAVAMGAWLLLSIPAASFYESVIARPGQIGGARTGAWWELAQKVGLRYDNLPAVMGLRIIHTAVPLYWACATGMVGVLVLWFVTRRDPAGPAEDASRALHALMLVPGTYVTSLLLGFVANNQTQNSVAFYPVAGGLLHALVAATLRVFDHGGRLVLGVRPVALRWWTRAARTALVVLSIVLVSRWARDTVTWATEVDMPRMVNDMSFDFGLASRSAESMPREMQFLRWTPSPRSYELNDWTALLTFLRERDQNFFVLGDNLLSYGMLGKPSIAPSLWFHPGLTMPTPEEPGFGAYERDVLHRLRRYDVRLIVQEGDETRMHVSLGQLPELSAWLAADWEQTRTFGLYRVWERRSP
jgi:hypothetical protein